MPARHGGQHRGLRGMMKTGLTHSYLLKRGVRVQVKYEPGKKDHVTFDDETQSILARNPQMVKKE